MSAQRRAGKLPKFTTNHSTTASFSTVNQRKFSTAHNPEINKTGANFRSKFKNNNSNKPLFAKKFHNHKLASSMKKNPTTNNIRLKAKAAVVLPKKKPTYRGNFHNSNNTPISIKNNNVKETLHITREKNNDNAKTLQTRNIAMSISIVNDENNGNSTQTKQETHVPILVPASYLSSIAHQSGPIPMFSSQAQQQQPFREPEEKRQIADDDDDNDNYYGQDNDIEIGKHDTKLQRPRKNDLISNVASVVTIPQSAAYENNVPGDNQQYIINRNFAAQNNLLPKRKYEIIVNNNDNSNVQKQTLSQRFQAL